MHSTKRNITCEIPIMDTNSIVGKYLTYPSADVGKKNAEGGMRISGKYKCSLPEIPLVTIITVCFNSVKTLEQSIRSVLQQSYENIEYIIIDGASTDKTLDLIKKFENEIDYFLSEPDEGLYYAMNKGLELASGDYIIFLNSDDWYETGCIKQLIQGLKVSGLDFSSALARRVDNDGNEVDILQSMPYDDSLRFGMSLRHELMLVSANIYNKVGSYDTTYRIISDFDFAIRLFNAGYLVYEIQYPLLNFRITGVSNTDWGTITDEHYKLLKSQFINVKKDDLVTLSDPRKYTAEIIDQALINNTNEKLFIESLIAYGYRRKLYNTEKKPILQPTVKPMVSVIVPAFNSSSSIVRCLNSILNQSLIELEIICINDASTDETEYHINLIKDHRIRLITNNYNLGVAASRNIGIKESKGRYIFFVDADDELMDDALNALVLVAEKEHSDLVKGAYEKIFENGESKVIGYNLDNVSNETTLHQSPELLTNTEGFWTYLYRRSFISNARFSDNLKMGEDSLFLISSLVRAKKIAWITNVVYRYYIHTGSAMNNFDHYKYLNAIEWRERAWQIFHDHGFDKLANWCAFDYWNPVFFSNLPNELNLEQLLQVQNRLKTMLINTGYIPSLSQSHDIAKIFDPIYHSFITENIVRRTNEFTPNKYVDLRGKADVVSQLQIGVFSTMDRGGAGTGSLCRIKALHGEGIKVTFHTLITAGGYKFSRGLIPVESQDAAWKKLKKLIIDPVMNNPDYTGSELFSISRSVVDFTQYKKLVDSLDIIHLHWVVGIFDYQNFGSIVGNKKVVWTLADMNAFTGGCHYSEGCVEYEKQCRYCHLLPYGSTLAHEQWKIKRLAYDKIKNLEIICPSEWMAERVSKSTLLGDRVVNVIPNALPIKSFTPINRLVARIKLGLPLNKKLILFGADSLESKRKGGDILKESLGHLSNIADIRDVEVMTYGHHSLNLPLPTHALGFINGSEQLKLVYSAANVFAFPSREDNAPLTVAESLMCGTPVVAFPIGNLPELIKHNSTGYIAKYLCVDDFSKGLQWALYNNIEKEFSIINNSRKIAIKHHNPKLAVNRHLQVYLDHAQGIR